MHFINARVFKPRGAGGQPAKILIVLFIILHILPIFLALRFFSVWFYLGLIFYIIGMVIGFLAIYGFVITPVDKPVTKNIFRYSRNPMYLGGFLFFIGIGLITVSWIYLLITLIWVILLQVIDIPLEESECIKKCGKDYKEYMKNTPRWIGKPK